MSLFNYITNILKVLYIFQILLLIYIIMKHIKNFKTFESVILPDNFDECLSNLKENEGTLTLDKINNICKSYGIMFINVDEFTNSLSTEKEKSNVPRSLEIMGGLKFAAYNKYLNSITMVVEPKKFIDYMNDMKPKQQFYDFIWEVLRHESIHRHQVSRMKKDVYNLEKSPVNPKEYFSMPQEVMAYAQSTIDQLTKRGMTKIEILDQLRSGDIKSWVYNAYKHHVDDRTFKMFKKYIYQYLETIK
jgi:hypothetical protein